jgi:O-antigen/teichoic acid export membrane protein
VKKRSLSGALVQNALALIASGAGSAIIGLAFWGVAAHLVSPVKVGRASAEIAAMSLIALLAQLSYGSTFERFLPVAGDQTRAFIVRAYRMCITVALVIGVGYVALGFGHRFLPVALQWRALFVASVILWVIFALQDSALIGLRSTRWVPVENILYSIVKLALLPAFILLSANQGVFLAWMIPVVPMNIAVNYYIFRKRVPYHAGLNLSSEKLPTTRELLGLAGAQYASLLVNVLTGSIVTLIVIDRLGPVANAHYYIPAQIALGATLLLLAITRVFIVEASSEPERLRHFAYTTMMTMIVLLGPSIVIGVIIAPEVLGIFGSQYADHGTTLLRMLILSVPAMAVTNFYFSFALLDRRVWWFAVRQLISSAVFFTVMLTLLGHFGIVAIGIASLIESGMQAIFFLPILIRRYRRSVDAGPAGGSTVSELPDG